MKWTKAAFSASAKAPIILLFAIELIWKINISCKKNDLIIYFAVTTDDDESNT